MFFKENIPFLSQRCLLTRHEITNGSQLCPKVDVDANLPLRKRNLRNFVQITSKNKYLCSKGRLLAHDEITNGAPMRPKVDVDAKLSLRKRNSVQRTSKNKHLCAKERLLARHEITNERQKAVVDANKVV